jgi:hypothetical protein
MRRFVENRFAFGAIFSLFMVAFAWNAVQGAPAAGLLIQPKVVTVAHGPLLPPDPWEGNLMLAHGPLLPPDPWEGNLMLAHGPLLPPDPWEGNLMLAHGPLLPPDPWEGNFTVVSA